MIAITQQRTVGKCVVGLAFLCTVVFAWPAQAAERGFASWYGPGFYGHKTACGPILRKISYWIAHKSLPCGTKVRVTNKANGRSIVVQVFDRGPYIRDRIVDLTVAAAGALGISGTAPVQVDVLR